MKKLVVSTLAMGLMLSGSMALAANLKIGVVNYIKVFQSTPQGKGTAEQLQDALKPRLAELKSESEALQQQIETFNRNSPTMSKEDRANQEKILGIKQKAFQKEVAALQSGEQQKEHLAANKFAKALKSTVTKIAQKDGYNLILNEQAAPYASSELDITNQVISDMR